MVEIKTFDSAGGNLSRTDIDETAFGDKVKRRLLREAILMYESNRRQGTHSTLTRAEVNRTGRKPYRQKGTGYARCGDFKSPLRRGGGVVFGPKPRDYSYSIPRTAKREALRNALFAKLKDGEVFFIKGFAPGKPSTRQATAGLKQLELSGSVAVFSKGGDPVVFKSYRNIAGVSVVPVEDVNAEHVIRYRNVVFVNDAFDALKERLGNG